MNGEDLHEQNFFTVFFFLSENLIVSHFFAISMIDFNTNCITLNIKLVPIVFFDISIYYLLAYYFFFLCTFLIYIIPYFILIYDIGKTTEENVAEDKFLRFIIYSLLYFSFFFL